MDWREWFSINRPNTGYSFVQSLEYMYPVYNHIYHSFPPPASLLEIGCGLGDSARALSIMGYNVTGIDNDHTILEMAKNHPVPYNGNLSFTHGDAFTPPTGYDIATSFGIVEHFHCSERVLLLKAMRRSARKLIVTIPSPSLCKLSDRAMGEMDITLPQLIEECNKAGWIIIRSFGWGVPPELFKLYNYTPPNIWRRLQGRGKCSLSFCVMGISPCA